MTYTPIALPPLPRKRCPGEYVRGVTRYGSKQGMYMVKAPCTAAPLTNGWCANHQHAQELLDYGQALGYPGMQVNEGLWIAEGICNWEVYAARYPLKRREQMLRALLRLESEIKYAKFE